MRRETIKNIVITSAFFGSLWGMAEATLGYFFHFLSHIIPGIAGFFMFPIGFYFMTKALRETGKLSSIFCTASVAATIKLVDLFLPFLSPIDTLNPAVSILMESLAVILVFRIVSLEKGAFGFKQALITSAGWRVAFALYLSIFSLPYGLLMSGFKNILRFLLLDSAINGIIIFAYLKIEKPKKEWPFARIMRAHPSISFLIVVVAISTELIFSFI